MTTIKERAVKQAGMTATVVVVADYIFRVLFTKPMETSGYFASIAGIAFVAAYFLFSANIKPSNKQALAYAVAASVTKGVFYRVVEKVQGAAYTSRVPDIFGVAVQSNTYLSTALWFVFHAAFFYVGVKAATTHITR